jgi:hypothetical protein
LLSHARQCVLSPLVLHLCLKANEKADEDSNAAVELVEKLANPSDLQIMAQSSDGENG